jgi:hypothetical protein
MTVTVGLRHWPLTRTVPGGRPGEPGSPLTIWVVCLFVKHSFRRDRRSGGRCSLLATGKYSAPARSLAHCQELKFTTWHRFYL